MGEEALERIRTKLKDQQPQYDEALAAAGGPELSPKVQALVDAVLRYDGSMGPHGAIWHLAKAHTIALELVAPRAAIEEYEILKKREQSILDALKAAELGDHSAAEELNQFFDETGRPLQ
jgi:hypothetical protein